MSELPKMRIGLKTYYVDKRLEELRNVKNPHDFMALDEAIRLTKAKLHSLRLSQDATVNQIYEQLRNLQILGVEDDRAGNPYSLYMAGVSTEELERAKQAEAEITQAIRDFAKIFKTIKEKYPEVGMGDTASDEALSHQVWKAIRYGLA
jgi:hypothetical protein